MANTKNSKTVCPKCRGGGVVYRGRTLVAIPCSRCTQSKKGFKAESDPCTVCGSSLYIDTTSGKMPCMLCLSKQVKTMHTAIRDPQSTPLSTSYWYAADPGLQEATVFSHCPTWNKKAKIWQMPTVKAADERTYSMPWPVFLLAIGLPSDTILFPLDKDQWKQPPIEFTLESKIFIPVPVLGGNKLRLI